MLPRPSNLQEKESKGFVRTLENDKEGMVAKMFLSICDTLTRDNLDYVIIHVYVHTDTNTYAFMY